MKTYLYRLPKEFFGTMTGSPAGPRKIYISGKISGRAEEAREEFARAQRLLQDLGHTAVNPFENGLGEDAPWERHLAADLLALLECDAVLLLPGWEESLGARLEREVAMRRNLPVLTLDAPRP